jgi:hypothetical protein
MIVDDLDVVRAVLVPCKAYPPLLIDPNAVLPSAVPFQGFEPVAGEHLQGSEGVGGIQDAEALFRLAGERLKLAHLFAAKQLRRADVFEAADHALFLA